MEDEVVLEMPVFLSKAFKDHLYLLQYPVKPANICSNINIVEAKFKPKQQKLQITSRLDTSSRSYDRKKAEDLAADKKNSEGKSLFASGKMDHQVFESERAVQQSSPYVVGVISHNEVHLSPLNGILNMRPSFAHMQSSVKESSDAAEEENVDEPEAVMVKFARQETDRMRLARERSYWYLQQKNAEEKWISLNFHSQDSDKSELEKEQLVYGSAEDDMVNVHCPSEDYLKSLLPAVDTQKDSVICNNKSRSLTQLKHLPLTDQVHAIFINARVLQFDQLVSLLRYPGCAANVDHRELLLAVQQHAHLVRGVWVVKSDTLYAAQGTSSISPTLLSRGRDFILYMFTQKELLERRFVTASTKLPADEIEEILKEVAVYVKQKGWAFKLERDEKFEIMYPDIVRRQEMLWEGRHQQLSKDFKEQTRQAAKSPRTRKTSRGGGRDSFSDGDSGSEGSRKRRRSGRGEVTIPPLKL